MQKKNLPYSLLLLLVISLFSCSKEQIEKFDSPFVHIMENDQSDIVVNTNRRDVASYFIYYSTKANDKNLEVNYSIIPGDGLLEGRDYEVLTTENPLLFPSGIYRRPVKIQWLRRIVEAGKDNTLTIRINQTNNTEVSIGLPGPGNEQSEFIIEKVN